MNLFGRREGKAFAMSGHTANVIAKVMLNGQTNKLSLMILATFSSSVFFKPQGQAVAIPRRIIAFRAFALPKLWPKDRNYGMKKGERAIPLSNKPTLESTSTGH